MGHFVPIIYSLVIFYLLGPVSLDHVHQHRMKRQLSLHASLSSTQPPMTESKYNSKVSASYHNQLTGSIEEKFQINKNSIIRTHDSRALGAKYLNETDLASNEECLRWCWNTTNCNLAVYEEKVSWLS